MVDAGSGRSPRGHGAGLFSDLPSALFGGLLLASSVFLAGSSSAQQPPLPPVWACQDEICQRATRNGERLSLEMQNRRAQTAWIVVEPFGLSNVKPLRPALYAIQVGPGETRTAGILTIEDTTKPYAYQAKWQAVAGNPHAVHDDRWHYRMPFGGSSPITISQGYDGPFTHKGLGAYALDFPMPLDTPVLAARGGTLVEIADGHATYSIRTDENEGDNRVMIEHVDGTLSLYAHLRHGGSARLGQHVESGDRIGLSGDSGFSTGPHLHFEVFKVRPDGQRQTIPVQFWDGTAKGFSPLVGRAYAPGCERARRSSCRPGELASETSASARHD